MSKAKKSLLCSVFIWGSGQFFVCRQRLKGLLFFLMQVIVVSVELGTGYWIEVYTNNIPFQMRLHGGFFTKGVWGLVTLGVKPGAKVGDHSMMLMIKGVITVIILLLIVLIYIGNVRDAYYSGETVEKAGGVYTTSKSWLIEFYKTRFPYIVTAPVIIAVLFISVMPMLFSVLTAFTDYTRGNLPPANLIHWIGFSNFVKLFKVPVWSSTFFNVLGWTVIWTICATLSCYIMGLIQALILGSDYIKCKKLFRTIMILPWMMPTMVCLLVFRNIFNGQFGPLNQFLLNMGWISERIPFLTDPVLAKITVLGVNLWLGFGSSLLMISGVLSNMDPSLYEAARIDGAAAFSCFRFITLPMLLRVTMPLLVMSFAGNFNNFGAIFFLTNGGPVNPNYQIAGDTDILISWIYKLTLDNQMYSMAAVMSILIFIVVGSIAYWNFKRTTAFKEV